MIDKTKARLLLAALGFVEGTGFPGEVWTNPESEWMAQAWVWLDGNYEDCILGGFNFNYDARAGLNLKEFFKWWEKASVADNDHSEWEIGMREAGRL